MNWKSALTRRVLGKDGGQKQVERFLLAHAPRFKAPTDARTWPREAARLRREVLEKVYLHGYPAKWRDSKPRVVWGEVLHPDPAYRIRKLRYEIYPDYWIPALLYEPLRAPGKLPGVLNPNGHHRGGKAADYKQARCVNLAKRGLLALNIEFIGMGELEADCDHYKFAYLDLVGMNAAGLFYLALQKGLDVLLSHPRIDRTRVGVTGLSGGGWQTIVISALDPRVTLCVPVAGYTSVGARIGCINDIGDVEQTPTDLLTVLDYQHLTAMLAPRPTLQIMNAKDDCCFRTDRAKPVIYDAVRPTFRAFGALDRFDWHSNTDPGTHNYGADNRAALYRFLKKHWDLPADTPVMDIHRADELLTEERINVGLPATQTTMVDIVRRRARELTARLRTPRTAAQKKALRKKLAEVIRLPRYDCRGKRVGGDRRVGVYALRCGPWTLPVSAAMRSTRQATLVLASNRALSGWLPLDLAGGAVFMADLLGCGELASDDRHLMMVSCVGQRLLGVQVAQTLAVARWVRRITGVRKVHLHGLDKTRSLVALVAAALEPGLFASVTVGQGLTTLRLLAEWSTSYAEAQTMLCFGLLEVADVPQLRALLDGVEYRQPNRAVVAG